MRAHVLFGFPPVATGERPGFVVERAPCDLCTPPKLPGPPSGLCVGCDGTGISNIPNNLFDPVHEPCVLCDSTGRCFRCGGTQEIPVHRPAPKPSPARDALDAVKRLDAMHAAGQLPFDDYVQARREVLARSERS